MTKRKVIHVWPVLVILGSNSPNVLELIPRSLLRLWPERYIRNSNYISDIIRHDGISFEILQVSGRRLAYLIISPHSSVRSLRTPHRMSPNMETSFTQIAKFKMTFEWGGIDAQVTYAGIMTTGHLLWVHLQN